MDSLLTVDEAADALRLSVKSVRRRVAAHELRALTLGSGPKAPVRIHPRRARTLQGSLRAAEGGPDVIGQEVHVRALQILAKEGRRYDYSADEYVAAFLRAQEELDASPVEGRV